MLTVAEVGAQLIKTNLLTTTVIDFALVCIKTRSIETATLKPRITLAAETSFERFAFSLTTLSTGTAVLTVTLIDICLTAFTSIAGQAGAVIAIDPVDTRAAVGTGVPVTLIDIGLTAFASIAG